MKDPIPAAGIQSCTDIFAPLQGQQQGHATFLAHQLQLGLSLSTAQRQSIGRGMHGHYTEPFLVKQENIWNTSTRKRKGMSNADMEGNRGRWENSVQRAGKC